MTPKPERESSVDMVGLDLPYRLSAFSPSDLNIKPSRWFAFVWCALHRDGSLSSHGSCFNQHGSHSAIYTIITTQSPPTLLPASHMLSQHVFGGRVAYLPCSFLLWSLLWCCSQLRLALSDSSLSRRLSPAGFSLECEAVSCCATCTPAHICTPDV